MPTPTSDPFETDGTGDRRPIRAHRRRGQAVLGVGIVVVLLAGAGCGGDDDDAASDKGTETGSDNGVDMATYCAAALALATRTDPEIYVSMTGQQQTEVLITWTRETVQPLVAQLEPTVPEDLKDAVTTINDALRQVVGGDVNAADNPEVDAAYHTFYTYDIDHCGWKNLSVTATEYSFEGIPTTLPAGPTGFDLTNNGTEAHELFLLRKNDGVTQSFEQILALPDDQAMQMVTQLNQRAGPLLHGEEDGITFDLSPGDYLALCSIPTGTTSLDAPGDGPPHLTQGMVAELTVT